MSYRPICDVWFLARAKYSDGSKRYGGYLGGFPERARVLIGCNSRDAVLHVCGGKARFYPYKRGFGKFDKTLDLDKSVNPDFLQDARKPYPFNEGKLWAGILIDPPYSELDAQHYPPGKARILRLIYSLRILLTCCVPGVASALFTIFCQKRQRIVSL